MADDTIIPFIFEEEHPLRVLLRDGEPWFVAADVCRALGIDDARKAVGPLDDDEKATVNLVNTRSSTPGIPPAELANTPYSTRGNPNVWVISESGLYVLALRARDGVTPGTVAHRFRRWVTGEVLPQIRRTGAYGRSAEMSVRDKLLMVRDAERLFGREAGRELWFQFGLRASKSMRDMQGNLFPRPGEGGGK